MTLTQAQLEMRRTGITSTDVVRLVAGQEIAVYLDKMGYAAQMPETPRMRAGNKLEPIIGAWAAEELGVDITPGTTERHAIFEEFMTTPDFGILEQGQRVSILECKNVDRLRAAAWRNEGLPDAHDVQVTWALHVTGLRVGYVAGLVGGNDLQLRKVDYDEEFARNLVRIASRFWRKHVLEHCPPAADGSDGFTRYLKGKFQGHQQEMLIADLEIEEMLTQLRSYDRAEKSAHVEAERLRQQLMERIQGKKGIAGKCGSLTWVERREHTVREHVQRASKSLVARWKE